MTNDDAPDLDAAPLTQDDLAEIRDIAAAMRGDTAALIHAITELVQAQTRPLKVGISVVAAVAALFTGLVGLGAWYVTDQLHDNAVIACEGGNDRLLDQKGVWQGLVLQSEAETDAEANALRILNDHVEKVYKPRDCDHLEIPYEPAGDFPDLGLGEPQHPNPKK